MPRERKILISATTLLAGISIGGYQFVKNLIQADPFYPLYEEKCSACHGENLESTTLGTPLIGVDLAHGDSTAEIRKSIAEGFPASGMPPWSDRLDDGQVQSLAIFVSEKRDDLEFSDFRIDAPLVIPTDTIETEHHEFRIETVTSDLHPFPYSIAPLPDGRILLTEKTLGLSIISPHGEQFELIQGAPPAYDDGITVPFLQVELGVGWMMDVAIHPDYENDGWVYVHYGDRCDDCNASSAESGDSVSMNRLDRGRVRDGEWVDVETIWRADIETYTSSPDIMAGGRIALDGEGYVFFSVGMKGPSNYAGIQDLTQPYGKVYRVHDNGSLPSDNPFVVTQAETRPFADDVAGVKGAIWTFGHRSPQGLESNHLTKQLWGTEMGPRGGDELNLLLPGKNFGWPIYSLGVDYDGTPVEYGKELGIEFDLKDIEQPVVDWTPSPAVSSFIFYEGNAFPEWQHNAIVGTLKATELYRVVLEDNKLVHIETLLQGFARIRDIETGTDGTIYLLLEHASGGQIVRLVPEPN